jgi:hypothetical protein
VCALYSLLKGPQAILESGRRSATRGCVGAVRWITQSSRPDDSPNGKYLDTGIVSLGRLVSHSIC